jgi:hypothetical protein
MKKLNISGAILLLFLGFVLSSGSCTPETIINPDPDPDPPVVNSDGNIGPRANNYDDPANGIYVSTTGNDVTATGAIDHPYKSINAALDAAGSGATIILRNGTYKEGINVRVRNSNVTIKSRKGEWAVIDLTTHNPGRDEDSGVYFDVGSSGGK